MKAEELDQLKNALRSLDGAFDAIALGYEIEGVMHAHRTLRKLVATAKVRAPKDAAA